MAVGSDLHGVIRKVDKYSMRKIIMILILALQRDRDLGGTVAQAQEAVKDTSSAEAAKNKPVQSLPPRFFLQ